MKKNNIKLEEGEIICSKCNGSGESYTDPIYVEYFGNKSCKKCKGKGKLDWIEVIVGKKHIVPIPFSIRTGIYIAKYDINYFKKFIVVNNETIT